MGKPPRGRAIGSPVVTLLGIGVPGPGGVKIFRIMKIVCVCLLWFLGDWNYSNKTLSKLLDCYSYLIFRDL